MIQTKNAGSFFRYPGGKSRGSLRDRLLRTISQAFEDVPFSEYREPFVGGGGIAIPTLLHLAELNEPAKVWINDLDIGIASVWTAVIRYPERFKEGIRQFVPSVQEFHSMREALLNARLPPSREDDIVRLAVQKVAIHQTSYSGLGTMSGGPLGGELQDSDYPIDCRWSPERICSRISFLHERLKTLTFRDNGCTCRDFFSLIRDCSNAALLYLDPPYYAKGSSLYQHSFTEGDHHRLADHLKSAPHYWVLSYDACPEIEELYSWASIERVQVGYSITAAISEDGTKVSRTKEEFIITPKGIFNGRMF